MLRHAVHAITPKEIRSRRLARFLVSRSSHTELRLAPAVVRALENGDDPPLPDAGVLQRVFDRLEAVSNKKSLMKKTESARCRRGATETRH